jgi:hypothetical protein
MKKYLLQISSWAKIIDIFFPKSALKIVENSPLRCVFPTILSPTKKCRLFLNAYLCLLFSIQLYAQKPTSRILLIPLDDRPPCLQFAVKMGNIADAQLVTPPRELLGRFTDFGKSDAIIDWLKAQDLSQYDAAIISMDMLAYGGLVASRVHVTDLEKASQRIDIVRVIRQKNSKLRIYGSSVIMRIAPTADGKNETYREKLARWADYSPYPEHQEAVAQLEKEIPAEAIANYKKARERNLKINQKAIELVKENVFDYLILSQDDAKPKGIHVQDRETLIAEVKRSNLGDKIAVQPGADEVSMLLLSRALTHKYNYHPKLKAIYSSEDMADKAMPFEDRPLRKTVSFHIMAAGGVEVQDTQQADIFFYVYTSRHSEGAALTFAENIAKNTHKGIIIADIDPIGDVQGGHTAFTEGVLQRGVFPKIYGYACWNTAGNTIGTALPHGLVFGVFQQILTQNPKRKVKKRMACAQTWYTLNRLLDDYAYHTLVRPKAQALIKEKKWNAFKLTPEQAAIIKDYCLKELEPIAQNIAKKYKNIYNQAGSMTEGDKPLKLSKLTFDLPWNRTFEGEIDFKMD